MEISFPQKGGFRPRRRRSNNSEYVHIKSHNDVPNAIRNAVGGWLPKTIVNWYFNYWRWSNYHFEYSANEEGDFFLSFPVLLHNNDDAMCRIEYLNDRILYVAALHGNLSLYEGIRRRRILGNYIYEVISIISILAITISCHFYVPTTTIGTVYRFLDQFFNGVLTIRRSEKPKTTRNLHCKPLLFLSLCYVNINQIIHLLIKWYFIFKWLTSYFLCFPMNHHPRFSFSNSSTSVNH